MNGPVMVIFPGSKQESDILRCPKSFLRSWIGEGQSHDFVELTICLWSEVLTWSWRVSSAGTYPVSDFGTSSGLPALDIQEFGSKVISKYFNSFLGHLTYISIANLRIS